VLLLELPLPDTDEEYVALLERLGDEVKEDVRLVEGEIETDLHELTVCDAVPVIDTVTMLLNVIAIDCVKDGLEEEDELNVPFPETDEVYVALLERLGEGDKEGVKLVEEVIVTDLQVLVVNDVDLVIDGLDDESLLKVPFIVTVDEKTVLNV